MLEIDFGTLLRTSSKEATERREAAFTRIEDALGVSDTRKLPLAYAGQDREGQYLQGLAFGKAIMDDEIKHRHGIFDYHSHRFALIIASPFGHNPLMFGPTLRLQTSPEQRDYWVPLLEAGKIIGTYAQTELGHGTFLRGLETTVTLDLDTDEFVVHSPTLTSTKYWPSALGFTASHAVVMANLVIRGKVRRSPSLPFFTSRHGKNLETWSREIDLISSSVYTDCGMITRTMVCSHLWFSSATLTIIVLCQASRPAILASRWA